MIASPPLSRVSACAVVWLLLTAAAAVAQPAVPPASVMGTRPSESPLAPSTLSKPVFDTVEPKYDATVDREKHLGTVVAEVDGRNITMGDVSEAIRGMPPSVSAMPFEALFQSVVDQLIRRETLSAQARIAGLENEPAMRRRIKATVDLVLGNEYLQREISASISDRAVQERYERDIAGKPGPDEMRLRIIMVPSEAEATALITELQGGADFATIARRSSKDTTAKAGGDLGYMRYSDLNTEIGAVASSLPVGQINLLPVRRAGGWFIIKVEDRRKQKTPNFFSMRQQLRDAMVRERVPETVDRILATVAVRRYDMNGNEEAVLKIHPD